MIIRLQTQITYLVWWCRKSWWNFVQVVSFQASWASITVKNRLKILRRNIGSCTISAMSMEYLTSLPMLIRMTTLPRSIACSDLGILLHIIVMFPKQRSDCNPNTMCVKKNSELWSGQRVQVSRQPFFKSHRSI